jgi:hypothetical protein
LAKTALASMVDCAGAVWPFASAPVALALLVYWPVRIAIYGEDLFRFGGSDGATTGSVFAWVFYVFLLWSLALLVVGVRTVHGWTWGRSLAAVAFTAAIAGALAVAVTLLYAIA